MHSSQADPGRPPLREAIRLRDPHTGPEDVQRRQGGPLGLRELLRQPPALQSERTTEAAAVEDRTCGPALETYWEWKTSR